MLVVKEVDIVIYWQIKVVTRRLTRPLIGESFLMERDKLMKKILMILLSMMLLTLCACSSSEKTVDNDTYKVGILQLMTHGSLDEAREGMKDYLTEHGYENVEYIYQNPEGDQSNLSTMADSLINDNCDVIVAIATSPAQVLMQTNIDTPIVGTAITDYVGSGLVESNEHPGGYVTGVSDYFSSDKQVELIKELVNGIKKVGVLYTSSETNSEIQANEMVSALQKDGIEAVVKTTPDKNTTSETITALAKEGVEAIYIPTDNNLASSMGSVLQTVEEYGLPVVVGATAMVTDGGLANVGVDYYELGKLTGELVVKILEGASPSDLPIVYQEEGTINYNSKVAERIGYEIPASIIEKGNDLGA